SARARSAHGSIPAGRVRTQAQAPSRLRRPRLVAARRPAVRVAVLLVDHALDLLLQIRSHLHLVRILRVLGDLLEDLLVVLSPGHEIAVRSYVTAVEVLHGGAPGATAPPFPYARGPSKASGEGSARRAAGRAAQYRQLGYRLAGLAGEGTGEVLKPARRPRRSAHPRHQERRIELRGHQRGLYWTSYVVLSSARISTSASRSPRRSCQILIRCLPGGRSAMPYLPSSPVTAKAAVGSTTSQARIQGCTSQLTLNMPSFCSLVGTTWPGIGMA